MTNSRPFTWLRPEYEDRADELISLAVGAHLVGVTRATVSNWRKRHADFPKVALETGVKGRMKFVPRDEFMTFAMNQLGKSRGSQRGPSRPVSVIRDAKIEHSQRQIARLTGLEARQAAALARTRCALQQHRERLAQARRQLDAEVAAVRVAGYEATSSHGTPVGRLPAER